MKNTLKEEIEIKEIGLTFALGFVVNYMVLNKEADAGLKLLRDITIGTLGEPRDRLSNLSKWGKRNNVSHNTAYDLSQKFERAGIIDVIRDNNKIVFMELSPHLFREMEQEFSRRNKLHKNEMED